VDKIFLKGISANCVVGVWEWEKSITQEIIVDLELATDISKAAASDNLADTLDYKGVADRVIEMLEASRFDLIETMTEEIAKLLMNEFKIPWVKVRLDKGGVVKNVQNVGILIERGSL